MQNDDIFLRRKKSKVPLSNTLRLSEVKSVLQQDWWKDSCTIWTHGDDEVVTSKVETIMIPLEFLFENPYGFQQKYPVQIRHIK